MIPLVPDTSTPAMQHASIEIDLVMVTAPNPPGSSTSISPPGAVFEIAPANVLHGAVRLHGFASSPTPETQVRVACALAGVTPSASTATTLRKKQTNRFETLRLMILSTRCSWQAAEKGRTFGGHRLRVPRNPLV